MESKTARFTFLIEPERKEAFEALCKKQDMSPSQVVRRLIREYMAQHGQTEAEVIPLQRARKSR